MKKIWLALCLGWWVGAWGQGAEKQDRVQQELEHLVAQDMVLKSTYTFHTRAYQHAILIGDLERIRKLPSGIYVTENANPGDPPPATCSLSIKAPTYDRHWEIKPFSSPITIEQRATRGYRIVEVHPTSYAERQKWSLFCYLGTEKTLSETLKVAGFELEKASARFFFDPQNPPESVSNPITFSPRPELIEHLPRHTRLKITRDLDFPSSPKGNNPSKYLLSRRGPVECLMEVQASGNDRTLHAGDELQLERVSILGSPWTYSLDGPRWRQYWSWRWELSGVRGIRAIECIRQETSWKAGNDGLSIQDVQTVIGEFARLTSADGQEYPSHDLSQEPAAQEWKPYVFFRESKPIYQRPLSRLPRGTTISLSAQTLSLVPGTTQLVLTRPTAEWMCSLPVPEEKQKLRVLHRLNLAVTADEERENPRSLRVDIGGTISELNCQNKDPKAELTLATLRSALKPEFEVKPSTALAFGEREPALNGVLDLRDRYRTCGGVFSRDTSFTFTREVRIDALAKSLDLGNGCTLNVTSARVDRIIRKDDNFVAGKWDFERTVEQIEAPGLKGNFRTKDVRIDPWWVGKLECSFPSLFVADADPSLSCEEEFLRTLEKLSATDTSVVRVSRQALMAGKWQGQEWTR